MSDSIFIIQKISKNLYTIIYLQINIFYIILYSENNINHHYIYLFITLLGVPVPYVKFKIDELDEAKFTYKYTLMEGGELNETIQSITIEMKFESTADGGCINKIKKFITVAEGAKLNPEELKAYKVKARMLFDRVESYLLENPDIYA